MSGLEEHPIKSSSHERSKTRSGYRQVRQRPLDSIRTAYWMVSNWIRSRVPVARAILSSARVDGGVCPLSNRATADCVVFMRVASSAWGQARARARLDQRTSHLVLRPQSFVRLAIVRISVPPFVQFGNRAHFNASRRVTAPPRSLPPRTLGHTKRTGPTRATPCR